MSVAPDSPYTTDSLHPERAQDVWKDEGKAVDFVVLRLNRKDQHAEQQGIYQFADRSQAIIRSMRIRQAAHHLKVAIGFSDEAWDYLFPGDPKPAQLEKFTGFKGKKFNLPATGGDIFLHVRADNEAVVYEVVKQFMTFLRPWATVQDETHGFRYLEGRWIGGFIDGTEAPAAEDSARYATVGEEDPNFINGSYAFEQKWLHNMDYWDGLETETQEKAVGRRKWSDLELSDDHKFPNAHNIASKLEINGEERKIVRMNVPYSDPALDRTGTMFIGYARYWSDTKGMFQQMVDQGDFLLTFSDILTGQLFFIPSRDLLEEIADKIDDGGDSDRAVEPVETPAPADFPLGQHQPSVSGQDTGEGRGTSNEKTPTGKPDQTSGQGTPVEPDGVSKDQAKPGLANGRGTSTIINAKPPVPAENREVTGVGPDPVEIKTGAH